MDKTAQIEPASGDSVRFILKELRAWKKELLFDLHKSNENTRQDIVYQSILSQKVLPSDISLFSITSWSISPEFALWLYEHVRRRGARRIVELGSGLSTVILAAALKETGSGKLLSIEHEQRYFDQTASLLLENGLNDWVELVLCPLAPRIINREKFIWYSLTVEDIQGFLGGEEVDLLLVDGPPGKIHPLARFPAYPFFKKFMAQDGLVVLDDCARASEKKIMEKWASMENGKSQIRVLTNIRHFPAILYKSESIFSSLDAEKEGVFSMKNLNAIDSINMPDDSAVIKYATELVRRKILRAEYAEIIKLKHELHIERERQGWRLEKINQNAQLEVLTQKLINLDSCRQQLEEVEKRLILTCAKKDEALSESQERLIALGRDIESKSNELQTKSVELERLRATHELQRDMDTAEIKSLQSQLTASLDQYALLEQRYVENQGTRRGDELQAISDREKSELLNKELHALQDENVQLRQDIAKLKKRADSLNSERKEFLERITSLGKSITILEKELSNVRVKLAKSEHTLSESAAAFDVKRVAENEAENMSRDVFAAVSSLQRDDLYLRAELAKAEKKAEKIKGYLSYRLGSVIVENSANLLQWMKVPFKLKKAYSEYKAARSRNPAEIAEEPLNLDRTIVSDVRPTYVGLGGRWKELLIHSSQATGLGRFVKLSFLTPKVNASFTAEIQIASSISQVWDFKASSSSLFKLQTGESRSIELNGHPEPISLDISDIENRGFMIRMRKLRGSPCIVKVDISSEQKIGLARTGLGSSVPKLDFATKLKHSPIQSADDSVSRSVMEGPVNNTDPIDARLPKPISNAIMWQAQQLTLKYGADVGIGFAQKFGRDEVKLAANLMAANQEINDEFQWLSRLNSYLQQFPISPIELRKGPESRFERLCSTPNRKHMSGPLVTIIMPCFNSENTILHAVNSILNQTWENFELIIVDDASTDDTWQLVKQLEDQDKRIIPLRNSKNVGPYVSKNLALSMAKGAYITGHDADDWAHPERIAIQAMALLESHGKLKANMAKMLRMTEEGRFVYFTKETKISHDGVLRDAAISTMFEAEYFRKHLGHWDCVRFGADSELISRAEKIMGDKFQKIRQLVMLCLDAEGSLTNDPVHGLSKTSGMSPTRKYYKDQWVAWHKTAEVDDCYMPFPHTQRRFHVPEAAFVPEADIVANIAEHVNFRK